MLRSPLSASSRKSARHAECSWRFATARPEGRSSLDQRTLDDRRQVQSRRQGAERPTPLAAKSAGQEGLGYGGVSVPHQQRSLQRERDVLGDLAGPVLNALEVAEFCPQCAHVGVEAL